MRLTLRLAWLSLSALGLVAAACSSSDEIGTSTVNLPDSGVVTPGTGDAATALDATAGETADAGADAHDAAVVLADDFYGPVPYTSRANSPFAGVVFASYEHFEDWEDGLVNTPGVTPSSTALGSAFGSSLIDSVDSDDGTVDGKCEKAAGNCNSGFAGGTIDFTFDAAVLGALPTHVGIAWTDGATGCDAIFEAYDSGGTLIGTRTATGVGDGSNTGTVGEDRYFAVVSSGGVKKIVVKSSAGGVEVDHLHYGR